MQNGYTAAAATTCASSCSRLVCERQPFLRATADAWDQAEQHNTIAPDGGH